MTIHAWRIVKAKHAAAAFTGDNARRFGGRWNTPGVAMIYTAGSASLAMLEMLAHLQSHELLNHYVLFEVIFDEALATAVDIATLPKTWRKSPPPIAIRRIGDGWVGMGGSAVLKVPSVIVPTESNYLINPAHSDFAKITIGPKQPVRFDRRIIKP
ncbi:MAG: RES family NAD+ phosphorylase [Phycisphaeraceae bacterium]